LVAGLVLILGSCADGRPKGRTEAGGVGGALLGQVEAAARSLVEEGRAAGVSVAILKGDDAILSRGYGYADLEEEVPAGPGTLYRIASITKRYTAFAVLKLVEEDRLRLDTRVGEVLAGEFPAGRDATVAQLLNHTAGVPDMTSLGDRYWSQIGNRVAPADLVAIFGSEPLDFAPGTGYGYSNSGYVLLGRIVEEVTGMPYQRYVEENVLAPLGLDDTTPGWRAPTPSPATSCGRPIPPT
jgi:CubicO group peptidase (beta-lactamase class C family)